MHLKSVKLINYRAHTSLNVSLNDSFNTIVGINGSGKTSLLNGIAETFAGLFVGVNGVYSNPFSQNEFSHVKSLNFEGRYTFEKQYPVKVSAQWIASGESFESAVVATDSAGHRQINGESPFRSNRIADGSEESVQAILPLLVFYRANRQWITSRTNVIQAATERSGRYDAYANWWDAATSAPALESWVISKCLERFQRSSETGILFGDIDDDDLARVNGALATAIENIGDLRYDLGQKSLLVNWRRFDLNEHRTVSFDHLSDGQRAVIYLVGDIARRVSLLNPHLGLKAIQMTPGVVLIDELDVHLHPRWQRRIVTGLKKAFPSLQFITSSHSPQVLGELEPNEIILLRNGGASQPQVSYGLSSSQVLEEIMESPSRNVDVDESIKTVFVMIENGELNGARSKLAVLRELAPDVPELARADSLILRKEVLGR